MHRHGADDMRAARCGERCGRQRWQGPFNRIAEANGRGELTLGDDAAAEEALQVVAPVNPRRWWSLVWLNFRPRSRLHAGWQFGSAIAGADNTRAEHFEHAESDATSGRGEPIARLGLIGPGARSVTMGSIRRTRWTCHQTSLFQVLVSFALLLTGGGCAT